MGWRDRRRQKILYHLKASARCVRLPDIATLPVEGRRVKPRVLTFEADTDILLSGKSFQIAAERNQQLSRLQTQNHPLDTEIRFPSPWECVVRFQTPVAVPDLRLTPAVQVVAPGTLQFSPHVTRFSFLSKPREPSSLFAPAQSDRIAGGHIKRVTSPPPPPSLKEVDLEERLRWILTPPIHEVLSDPQLCLPEPPYPFQTIGIKWLYDRGFALLADEMGLGKTMQAIIAARLLYREGLIGQILVVCPKTLIPNWKTELRKWWPQVTHNISVVGSDRQWFLRLGTANVIVKIINYEALGREADWLATQRFSHDLVIIDEAQRIKSPKAQAARAVKALVAHRRWAMTGTPLENKEDDVVSIFEFLERGLLAYGDQAQKIRKAISPYMLRRCTEEVIKDFPEKIEQPLEVELDDAQREAYVQTETEGVRKLNEQGETVTVTHVFALITKLRQICNFDPSSGTSAKIDVLCEDLEEISASGRKALVFSQFVDDEFGLRRISRALKNHGPLELHGKVPPHMREAVVARFRDDPKSRVLLLNYAVGGVGLNLQAANYVYLFDRWWNPAVEDQAVKRAHRIGQTSKVFVRRFCCKDTVEERILQILRKKRLLFAHVIDEARPAESMGLTEEEIFSLFDLKVRPRKSAKKSQPVSVVVRNMDSREFENLVALTYEKQGYAVKLTGGSHDRGIDILAERAGGGGRERVVVQCKHYRGRVGRPTLQQLWGVVSDDHSITRGDLVTSGSFTSEAREFGAGKRLTLIDFDALQRLVQQCGVARFESGPLRGHGYAEDS